jgi:parallel beta-helix repeat protein
MANQGGLLSKTLVIGIIILFIGMSIIPSVAVDTIKKPIMPISDKTIITVDDEGDGDYISIQDAIDNATAGDIIEVYSGKYYEHSIKILEEGITLQGIPYELGNGNDIGKPFINGEGKGVLIFIEVKNVVIDGFKMENYGPPLVNGIIALRQGADGCTISNNDIAHTAMSCIWIVSSNNKILNNNISHSSMRQGIVLVEECKNNIISGNVISDVEIGIDLWDSNHNTIICNKISRCWEFGIDIAGSDFNTIKGNIFENNEVGVYIVNSIGSRIKNNNFINNQWQAQFVYGIHIFRGLTNRWNGNYWNESRSLPYPIRGVYFFFPWVQFDWFPAKEPYDIGVL